MPTAVNPVGQAETTADASAPSAAPVSIVVADDVEDYTTAIRGLGVEAVRIGKGFAPSIVSSIQGENLLAVSGSVGFPVLGRATIADDHLVAACITSAPAGSRWCEIDVNPGTVVIYAPGAEHNAVSPAGLRYSLAVAKREHLAKVADELELDFDAPRRGQILTLEPSARTNDLAYALSAVVESSRHSVDQGCSWEDDLLHVLTAALARPEHLGRAVGRAKIDNRHVVHRCIEYVKAVERIPLIRELCLVAHVSERRLRDAFAEVYRLAPGQFFRMWALDEARRRLVAADPDDGAVSRVAIDLGFGHLGRFAGKYQQVYGEYPSTTLSKRR